MTVFDVEIIEHPTLIIEPVVDDEQSHEADKIIMKPGRHAWSAIVFKMPSLKCWSVCGHYDHVVLRDKACLWRLNNVTIMLAPKPDIIGPESDIAMVATFKTIYRMTHSELASLNIRHDN